MLLSASRLGTALLVGLVPLAVAQPLPITHDRWGIEEGLPQSSVTAILQARDGYLWLGTFGGLARFDGAHFRTFVPATDPEMASGRILALAEDAAGDILVGTEDAGLLRVRGERVERVAAYPELPSDQVRVLLPDASAGLWVGTRLGLVRIEGGRVVQRFDDSDGLPSVSVSALATDPSGALWIGTGRGLARLAEGRIESWAGRGAPFDSPIRTLLADAEDLWLLCPSGLRRVRQGTAVATWPVPPEWSTVGALLREPRGLVWVGSLDLRHLAGDTLVLAVSAAELGGQNVRALAQDREGGIWVGTDGGGLIRFRRARARTLAAAQGIPPGSVSAVTEDARGTLWVATMCGGLARSSPGGTFVAVPRADGSGYGCVSALLADRGGRLWVGGNTLERAEDPQWRPLTGADGLPGSVRAVIETRDGAIWIGGESGLARWTGGALRPVASMAELGGAGVRALHEASDGSVWVGTGRGVVRCRGDRIETPAGAAALPPVAVRAIHETADGTLWLGTYGGGLARLRGGEARVLSTADGLADDVVSRILADDSGHLWLSGNRGISRVALADLEAVADGRRVRLEPFVLRARDGMASAECNGGTQPAGWRSRDGRLYFPTIAGVVVVDPRRMTRNELPPPVAVESVWIDGRRSQAASPVVIPTRAENVEIRFAALTFNDPASARFKYRLYGFDSGWVDAGNRRFARYTGLPPRELEFQVTAANEDGVWNDAGARVTLAVTPRFYQTRWFAVLVALGLLAAAVALHSLRTARLQRRQHELEAQVAERTVELADANREIARDLVLLGQRDAELEVLNRDLARRVAEQTAELRETRDTAILTLARLAELRDGATGAHLERISAYSRRLGEALRTRGFSGVDGAFVEQLVRSSPLHDIGKVAIPDAILRKPGPLDREEMAIMRTHATIGGDTLHSVLERYESQGYLAMAMEIAYGHHERWDGHGYPRARVGAQTPLPARIVALVDVFDALTSIRPYKPAVPHDEALHIIVEERGRAFDPDLVDVFVSIAGELPLLARRLPPDAGPPGGVQAAVH
jgi:response regulator RpfG family c-di-GMP phosphodiesterase/ligand-binding sensor domain-containing protein